MKHQWLSEEELIKAQKQILSDYVKAKESRRFSMAQFCVKHKITYSQFKAMMCNMSINVKQKIKKAEKDGEKFENQELFYYGVTDKHAEDSNEAIEVELGLEHQGCKASGFAGMRLFEHMEYSKFMVMVSVLNFKPTPGNLDAIDEIWVFRKGKTPTCGTQNEGLWHLMVFWL